MSTTRTVGYVVVLLIIAGSGIMIWQKTKPLPATAFNQLPPGKKWPDNMKQVVGSFEKAKEIQKKYVHLTADDLVSSCGEPMERSMEGKLGMWKYASIPGVPEEVTFVLKGDKVLGAKYRGTTYREGR